MKNNIVYTDGNNRRVRRNYIDLRHGSDTAAVTYIQNQIKKYLDFVPLFPTVKIVFLKIPYYSIQHFNKYLGNENYTSFRENDFHLTDIITLINDFIQEVNKTKEVSSPNFKKNY